MAIHRWISTDGDFSAAGSWDSGVAPSSWLAADECHFDGITSQQDATSGLNQSTVDIARFVIMDNYGGDIGVTGTPLQLDPTKTIMRGSGKLIFDRSAGAGSGSWFFLDSISGSRHIIDGIYENIFIKRGTADLSARTDGTQIHILDRRTDITIKDVSLIQYGNLYCYDGDIEMQGDFDALTNGKGIFMFGGTLVYNPQSGSADMPILQSGGIIEYNALLDSATTNGSWYLFGGTMDLRKAKGAGWPSTPDIIVGPNMNIVEPSVGFPSDSIRADLRDLVPQ